jgi:hypothetical protein
MKNYLTEAIRSLRPDSEFSFTDNDYSTIQWVVLEGDAPTQKQIDDEIKRIKANEITSAAKAEADKAALLTKLGITAEEAKLLLS